MKSEGISKHVIIAFILALVLYVGSFQLIEHRRQVKGPWLVTFLSDREGHPSVHVFHQQLGVSNVSFVFPDLRIDKTNTSEAIVFDSPITNIPFGRIIFLDTTFLPGTVTIDLFGNEIELLPRVLVLNKKEIPWKSEGSFRLSQKETLPGRKNP
jgi:hypothetical protein